MEFASREGSRRWTGLEGWDWGQPRWAASYGSREKKGSLVLAASGKGELLRLI